MVVGNEDGKLVYLKNTGTKTNPVYTQQNGADNPFDGVNVGRNAAPTSMDMDNDGDLDMVVGDGGQLVYLKNTGTNANPVYTQQNGVDNPFDGVNVGGSSTSMDMDNDGDLDMVVGGGDGNLVYLKNTGTNTNPVYTQQNGADNPFDGVKIGNNPAPTSMDMDNDGVLDMVVGTSSGKLVYLKNTGTKTNPVFTQQNGADNPFDGVNVGGYASPTSMDMDNDGVLDMVVGIDGKLVYLKNTGAKTNPVYTQQNGVDNPFDGVNVGSFAVPTSMDMDNDGDLDMVVGIKDDGKLVYLKNTGTNTNPVYTQQNGAENPFDGVNVGRNAAPTSMDMDNDGDLDMVVGTEDGKLVYLKNTGTKTNPVYTQQNGADNPLNGVDVGGMGGYAAPTSMDMNNDGVLDMVVGTEDGKLVYLKNTGTKTNPVYTQQNGADNPFNGVDVGDYAKPTSMDMDNDGDLDMVVGNNKESHKLVYLKNTGTNANPVYTQQNGVDNPFDTLDVGTRGAPTSMDTFNDGVLDMVVGNIDGKLVFFSTRCAPTPRCSGRGKCVRTSTSSKSTCMCAADAAGPHCTSCPAGKIEQRYKGGASLDIITPPTCVSCQAGKWSSTVGYSPARTPCTPCLPGHQFDNSISLGTKIAHCLACEKGQYQSEEGKTVW